MSLLDSASLICTPNGYKEGKLYSVIPSDGSGDMSVVRATTATRVNSSGLVELVPYNLLTYSEQFDNAAWTKSSATITANATTAPDGTTTADTLTITSGGYLLQELTLYPAVSGQSATISVYAKNQTTNFLIFGGATPSGTDTYTITDVGNGWYRHIRTRVFTTTTSAFPLQWIIYDQVGTHIIWGAQLVEGSTALPYQKTETRLNIPRLDYSNGTCPSLLVEPQRTNLALYSSSFDNAAWAKIAAGTGIAPVVTANSAISPDGYQNADTIVFNVGAGTTTSDQSYINQTLSVTSGSTYTFSVYLKGSVGGEQLIIRTASGSYTLLTLSNEWQRFSVTAAAASTGYAAHFGLRQGVAGTLNSTATVYAYGAQLELGSYPTSYIPTTSASVTRNADVISKTGISSLIGQTEGTLFLDYLYTELDINGNIPITIGLDAANHAYIYFRNNGVIRCDFIVGAAAQGRIDTSSSYAVKGTRYKIAFTYKANDFAVYINGQLIGTDNIGAITGLSYLFFNYPYYSGYNATSNINAVALWKTRLTNDELATLTTI